MLLAVRSQLTVDHASLSRRSTYSYRDAMAGGGGGGTYLLMQYVVISPLTTRSRRGTIPTPNRDTNIGVTFFAYVA